MMSDPSNKPSEEKSSKPLEIDEFESALSHVDSQLSSGNIAVSAWGPLRRIRELLIETLGALVGDPDLPEHSRSGYEGLLETARELRLKVGK